MVMRSQSEAREDAKYHAAQLADALQDADEPELLAQVEEIHAELTD